MTPHEILTKYFGFASFRPGQEVIVNSIIDGHDTLVLLPTGGGKSLCFQVPALALGGTTIVISPLISLMTDQVAKLQERGIAAACLTSSQTPVDRSQILHQLQTGTLQLLYLSPEKCATFDWQQVSRKIKIPLVVIDEAHCVVTWGVDFRPEYQHLAHSIASFHSRPIIAAFTATATLPAQQAIIDSLGLTSPHIHRHSCFRPNLELIICHTATSVAKNLLLYQLLRQHWSDTGIIYCATRAHCEQVTKLVKSWWSTSCSVAFYHAGIDGEARQHLQNDFISGKIQWLVSTNAFGMGVDKANIRFVIHYQPSTSLENYFQEVGRAGRDGNLSHCYLLWTEGDWETLRELLSDQDQIKTKQRLSTLRNLANYVTTRRCRHSQLLQYFGEKPLARSCLHCDICVKWHHIDSIHTEQIRQRFKLVLNRLPSPIRPSLHITRQQVELLVCHRPCTRLDFLNIPGCGTGWMSYWYPQLEPYLAKIYAFQPTRLCVDTTLHH